jgi:hypothetical protein
MLDPSRDPGFKPDATRRWVKVVAIIALVVVVLVVVMLLFGGGRHGPSRHVPGGNTGEQGMQQPPGATDRPPA